VLQETLRSGWIGGKDGDRLVLKADEELIGRFDWDGKRPKGLGGVIVRSKATPG
jgi:charged multivesicular body protein 7